MKKIIMFLAVSAIGISCAPNEYFGGLATSSLRGSGQELMTICHVPLGNIDNPQTITVGKPAVKFHMDNHPYDHMDACTCVDYGNCDSGLVDSGFDSGDTDQVLDDSGLDDSGFDPYQDLREPFSQGTWVQNGCSTAPFALGVFALIPMILIRRK